MRRSLSDKGAKFIAEFEGFRADAYRDAVGVLTIGYGHTHGVRTGQRVNQRQALRYLKQDAAEAAQSVNALGLPLNQRQFDALVSFVFNLGPGYLERGHTMGDALRRHDWKAAGKAFLLYDQAGGRVLLGLLRRRKAEKHLFRSRIRPYKGA